MGVTHAAPLRTGCPAGSGSAADKKSDRQLRLRCDVFADNAVTGTVVGKLNGYSSPDGVTDVPEFYGCQGKYCEIGFAAGPNGRAWVYDGFIDEPYDRVG